ncbi:MAG: hypothetical protein JKY89_11765 [Immundisolibacteraceae bacterium]|nr:hypothetical protein [Immundisolibacteraceae bacterium]
MILSDSQRSLRWQIEQVAFMGIHATRYWDGVSDQSGEFWMFTRNCYGQRAIFLWCQLFNGELDDPSHYLQLFGDDRLSDLGRQFSTARVLSRLEIASNLNASGLNEFRFEISGFRNDYSAQREYHKSGLRFPELGPALGMFQEMRVLLEETVVAEARSGSEQYITELLQYYQYDSNEDIQRKCFKDIDQLGFVD